MTLRLRIRKFEFGLLFRNGDLARLLRPGSYLLPGRLTGRDAVRVYDTLDTLFKHPQIDVLLDDSELRDELVDVNLNDEQRAIVWVDGRLGFVLPPGRYGLWKRPRKVEVEVCEVGVPFEHDKLDVIVSENAGMFEIIEVDARARVIAYRGGELLGELGPGRYAYWKTSARISSVRVDLREQVLDVAGQEIMTNDKVTLRVNLIVGYRVSDPMRATSTVHDYSQALYREAQLALRAAIGTRSLDALLTDKESAGDELRRAIVTRASEFGVDVQSVGLRDIILPGDMKQILGQVIEAQKVAEANLIRRREETTAARSQANTARLLADNPVLLRLKELEALGEILAGTNSTFVFGDSDLAAQVRSLTETRASK